MGCSWFNTETSKRKTSINNKNMHQIRRLKISSCSSPRLPLSSNGFYGVTVAVGRQSAIHTEHSGFASPTVGQHISTFRGYRILFSIRNPYINRFTNHFSIHS